jgi:hypothetical protein
VALLGLVGLGKLYAVTHPALVSGYLAQSFPVDGVNWLRGNRVPRRILNEYNWGGYLQWALRGYPIFVDGRTDLFNDEIVGEWIALVQGEPGWQTVLDRYAVDLVMLQPDRPLLARLREGGWKEIYAGAQVVIFER